MNYKLFPFLLLTLIQFSCQPSKIATIAGQLNTEIEQISINEKEIPVNPDGSFSFEMPLDHGTILNLKAADNSYELFVQPGKTVNLSLEKDSIIFLGDLADENNRLLLDIQVNNKVNKFLSTNWYSLHRKDESEFISALDSLRGLFLDGLDKANFDSEFVDVNTASVHYSFDYMILRYPQTHFNFTGERAPLSEKAKDGLASQHDLPNYRYLETYKRYVNFWLKDKVSEALVNHQDTTVYQGKVRLDMAIAIIQEEFQSPALQDFWSFEYIKSHIDEYTWINGQQEFEELKAECSTASVCSQYEAYKETLMKDREGHEIHVYKNAKGRQLEAHIFKPEDFDENKSYPAMAAFHGGGWAGGHASWTFESASHAAEKGMIGVAVEYRLSNWNDMTPVEAMEDARDLMKWLKTNSASLNIDSNRIMAKGISAGGHLASAISVLQKDANNTVPKALVLISPALDTSDDYFKSLMTNGIDPATVSPLKNLKAGIDMPPTLILQGRTDNLTPTKYAEAFTHKMDSLGYDGRIVIYEGCGHLFTPSHLDDTGWPQSDPEISAKAVQEQDKFLAELGYIE